MHQKEIIDDIYYYSFVFKLHVTETVHFVKMNVHR